MISDIYKSALEIITHLNNDINNRVWLSFLVKVQRKSFPIIFFSEWNQKPGKSAKMAMPKIFIFLIYLLFDNLYVST